MADDVSGLWVDVLLLLGPGPARLQRPADQPRRGREVPVRAEAPGGGRVIDLMSVLARSVAATTRTAPSSPHPDIDTANWSDSRATRRWAWRAPRSYNPNSLSCGGLVIRLDLRRSVR